MAKKFPKHLSTCVRHLRDLNLKRKDADRAAKKLKDKEDELRKHMINSYTNQQLKSIRGPKVLVSLVETEVPVVDNWKAFFSYAKRKGNEDLLQHSVSTPAWRERLADNKKVPGVKKFTRKSLRITHSR